MMNSTLRTVDVNTTDTRVHYWLSQIVTQKSGNRRYRRGHGYKCPPKSDQQTDDVQLKDLDPVSDTVLRQ